MSIVDGLKDIPEAVTVTVLADAGSVGQSAARAASHGSAVRRALMCMIIASAGTLRHRSRHRLLTFGRVVVQAGQSFGPHERLSALTRKARARPADASAPLAGLRVVDAS